MFIFFFLFAWGVHGLNYPSTTYNRNEILFVRTSTPVDISIGTDPVVVQSTGSFAFLATSFDMLVVTPEPDSVFRVPYDEIIDDSDLISDLPAPFSYISSTNRFVENAEEVPFEDVHTGGSVLVFDPVSTTIHRAYISRFPALSLTPVYYHIDQAFSIWCPFLTPSPPSFTFEATLTVSSDPDSIEFPVDTFILSCPDSPSYIISPAKDLMSYRIYYTIYLDATIISKGNFYIRGEPQMGDKSPIPPMGGSPPIPPNTHAGGVGGLPLTPPTTMLMLEPDQVLPRFKDSPAAFVRVTLSLFKAEPIRWIVEINGEAFSILGPDYVFAAHFATDYTVRLIPVVETGPVVTVPARLFAPSPVNLQVVYPIKAVCGGYIVRIDPLYPEHWIESSPFTITTPDGHVETFKVDLPPPAVCIFESSPAPVPVEDSFTINIDLAPSWHEGLTDEQICDGFLLVQFTFTSTIDRPLFFTISGGTLLPIPPEGFVRMPFTLDDSLDALCMYTDGGARLLACPVPTSTLSSIKSPVDFVPARVVSVSPFKSMANPGRINIAANVTDYTGAAVDTQRLTPGVYLATTTKRIQLFDPIKPWVTCTARELLTVPLATSPFASINPRLSKTTAECPRGVESRSARPFRVAGGKGVLWNEDTGKLESDYSTLPPGRYQFFDPASGEYSSIFELKDSPFSTDDFKLVRGVGGKPPTPPTSESGKVGGVGDLSLTGGSPPLGVWYPSTLSVRVEIVDCSPYSLDLSKYSSGVCPDDIVEVQKPGYVLLKNLPFVDVLIVQFIVGDVCSFTKRTQILPVSTGLPQAISSIRYEPECDGSFTLTPLYVDPYTMKERPIEYIPYASYHGVIESPFIESFSTTLSSKYINTSSISVRYTVSKDGEIVEKTQVFPVFHPPRFTPRIANPVFCPGANDARVVFDDVNFKGTINNMSVWSKGISGLGAGTYTFEYETLEGCRGSSTIRIKEKLHYDVEARVRATSGFDSSSITLLPGGEFDVITADMVKPEVRKYILDSGTGTREITDMPNGFGIEISIPYPESYSHIRQDFCPSSVILTAGFRTTIPSPSFYSDGEDGEETEEVECPPLERKEFGSLYIPGPYEKTGNVFTFVNASSCPRIIEWIVGDTGGVRDKSSTTKRRALGPGSATLSKITCTLTTPLSCPFCSDAVITVSTNALGPVIYVWTDIPISYTPVRAGVEAGTYFLTVIEQGSDVEYSPFCIVSVPPGPVVGIDSIDISFPKGCYGSARVNATVHSVGAVSFALIPSTDPPISSCVDVRLSVDNIFSLPVYLESYTPYICDGAVVVSGSNLVYNPVEPAPPTLVSMSSAELCTLEEGGYALSTPAVVVLENVTGGGGSGPRVFIDEPFEWETVGETVVVRLVNRTEAGTVIIRDARDCPLYVFVFVIIGASPGSCGVCGSGPGAEACLGCDGVPYSNVALDACGVCGGSNACDCLIPSNETVGEAVEEIKMCVGANRKVTGDLAPFINETVVLPASNNADMQFLRFEGLWVDSSLSFLLNVDITLNTTVRSPIFTLSGGNLGGIMTLPGDVNVGGLSPNQQVNLQYCTIEGVVTALPPGLNTLLLNWAYMNVGTTRIAVNRTGATVQLITTTIGVLELFLDSSGRRLPFSTNGGSRVDLLVIYIPGGWANVSANNTDVNGTRIPPYWEITSSNATLNIVCYYLINYPSLIKSGRGWYGGPTLNGTDVCTEFGGGGTPSQSQSHSHFKYESAPFPEELMVIFIGIAVVCVIASILVLFLYMKW